MPPDLLLGRLEVASPPAQIAVARNFPRLSLLLRVRLRDTLVNGGERLAPIIGGDAIRKSAEAVLQLAPEASPFVERDRLGQGDGAKAPYVFRLHLGALAARLDKIEGDPVTDTAEADVHCRSKW
jgi:hypothetical protein